MTTFHLAEVNIARMKGITIDDPIMAGFVARLDEINALADGSPGFVWRLQVEGGMAQYLRPFDDDRIIFNLSVWQTPQHLKDYVYKSMHKELLRDRRQWFEHFEASVLALWWVPVGHLPSVDEAKKRLAHLDEYGPSQFAFTFKNIFAPDEEYQRGLDWGMFEPCPAV